MTTAVGGSFAAGAMDLTLGFFLEMVSFAFAGSGARLTLASASTFSVVIPEFGWGFSAVAEFGTWVSRPRSGSAASSGLAFSGV
jgi:hypothetical protein